MGEFLNKRQVLLFFSSSGPVPAFVGSGTRAHAKVRTENVSVCTCYTSLCVCGPVCVPSRALQPTTRGSLGALGTRVPPPGDLLEHCRPAPDLGPPKARMETAPDTFHGQPWWAGSPSLGLTLTAGFPGILKHRGWTERRQHFG